MHHASRLLLIAAPFALVACHHASPNAGVADSGKSVAATSSTATPAAIANGKRLVSGAGTCELTVPAGWMTDTEGTALSPDASASAQISTDDAPLADYERALAFIGKKPLTVLEHSSRMTWLQYQTAAKTGDTVWTGKGSTDWYVSMPGNKGDFCRAHVSFSTPAQAAMAKQIALSVKPVR